MTRKKRFSAFSLPEALEVVGTNQLHEWHFEVQVQPPSKVFQHNLTRLKAHFDLSLSEAAKSLLIDAILLEAIDGFDSLKIWKEAALHTPDLNGTVDYLLAPQGKVYHSPLLCVVEAKKDDFEQGLAQCLVEMVACQTLNREAQADDTRVVYGIITNAVTWRFYKLTEAGAVYESAAYAESQLGYILGVLRTVFGWCAAEIR